MVVRWEDVETASAVAFAVVFFAAERAWPGAKVDRKRHLRRDLLAMLVVSVGVAISRKTLLALGSSLRLDAALSIAWVRELPTVAKIALGLVLVDFLLYWVHRAMHASALLWRTHAWHHSVEELYWFSGFRTSLTHAFLYAIPQIAVSFYILGLVGMQLAAASATGIFFQYFIHSSCDVRLGRLEWLVVTPRTHRLHHARGELRGRNLGMFLTLWDRAFGTYVDPRTVPQPERLGLDDEPGLARMVIGV
jgi:sterol desaturase/sphingolipid hydroxylase (fatty acid hydroxylase superfamily)